MVAVTNAIPVASLLLVLILPVPPPLIHNNYLDKCTVSVTFSERCRHVVVGTIGFQEFVQSFRNPWLICLRKSICLRLSWLSCLRRSTWLSRSIWCSTPVPDSTWDSTWDSTNDPTNCVYERPFATEFHDHGVHARRAALARSECHKSFQSLTSLVPRYLQESSRVSRRALEPNLFGIEIARRSLKEL